MERCDARSSEVDVKERKARQVKQHKQPVPPVPHLVDVEKQPLVEHALSSVRRDPEGRSEKVNALRTQIAAGTYQVNSRFIL